MRHPLSPYFYCDACGIGYHPLDAKLGLAPEHHQYDIQERTTRLGAELPYGVSDDQFGRLTGVPASSHFIHETLNAVGEAATLERVLPDADEIARRTQTARAGGRRRPVLVVACDGAHAPTRPPGGRKTKRGPGMRREAKGFRLYLLGQDERVIHVASWHQIADKAELSKALGVVTARISHDQVRIALMADGAEWIWDVFRDHFPTGEEILDYYQCAEHVHETARAQYGECTLEAQEWAEATLTRLCLNELGAVVGGLLRMKPCTPEAEEAIRMLSIYLAGQRERVGFDELRRRGLPRGSGGSGIRQQADLPCAAQTIGGVVARGQRQCDAAYPLCRLQRNIRAHLLRLHGPACGREAVTLNKSGTLPRGQSANPGECDPHDVATPPEPALADRIAAARAHTGRRRRAKLTPLTSYRFFGSLLLYGCTHRRFLVVQQK